MVGWGEVWLVTLHRWGVRPLIAREEPESLPGMIAGSLFPGLVTLRRASGELIDDFFSFSIIKTNLVLVATVKLNGELFQALAFVGCRCKYQ
jgi:hypothetical protein